MCASKPKAPKIPDPPPVVTENRAGDMASDRERRRLAGLTGRKSTILAGDTGGGAAGNIRKTLLGG